MKLETSSSYYNKLIDKSLVLSDRLKLAESLWDLDDSLSVQSNKQQLIIDWIIDLLVNKNRYSFNEDDFNSILERLNYFLNNSKFKNTSINAGLPFIQTLFEAFSSENKLLKQTVHECCFKLFKTKFSNYLTRNFDQMTRLTIYFMVDLNEKLISEKESLSFLEECLSRVYFILQKYYICLRSQQNLNRLFNRLCTNTMVHFLNLIENLKLMGHTSTECSNLVWKILKYGLFSKSHSNIYNEFFKNLPASFSTKSNYQVAALFNTLHTEATQNVSNLKPICQAIHTITRDLFTITNCEGYKQKLDMITFVIDLIWSLNVKSNCSDLIVEAMSNLLQIIEDLSLFNKVDDQSNQNLFKNWSKKLISETFKSEFNSIYVQFLVQFLHIDHVILDADLSLILRNLKIEANLTNFLNVYLECNVKFRQLSRAVHLLIDNVKNNSSLSLPIDFHHKFSESLENYNVDSQIIIHLWRDLNTKLLDQSLNSNLRIELLKFLNSLLSRVNLTNQRLPTHLKGQAIEYLDETKILLIKYLISETDMNDKNQILTHHLECFHTCGLVYLILYRYSITSSFYSQADSTRPVTAFLDDLNLFLNDLNNSFQLSSKIKKLLKSASNFKILFYLSKLQLLNVIAFNLKADRADTANQSILQLITTIDGLKAKTSTNLENDSELELAENFEIDQPIETAAYYSKLHTKLLLIDNFYLIVPLVNADEALLQKYLKVILQFIFATPSVIDKINMSSIFNDKPMLRHLLATLIDLLVEISDNTNTDKDLKALQKLSELIKTENDEELSSLLFSGKKFSKLSLNVKQSVLVQQLASYVPLEFIDTSQALVFYCLAEKMKNDQNQKIKIYLRLFASSMSVLEIMPMKQIELWLNELLDDFRTAELDLSNDIFDKLVKKCVKKLLIDDEKFSCLTSFVDVLVQKISTDNAVELNLNYVSFSHLTLIQILENTSKIQEFTLALDKENNTNNNNMDRMLKLNEIFDKILAYFIELTERKEDARSIGAYLCEFKDTHLFYICQILMRRVCSDVTSINQDNVKQFEYFQVLLKACMKTHKDKMKSVGNNVMEVDGECGTFKVSSFHVDFIRAFIYYSRILASKYGSLKVKPIKMCKCLISLLYDLNENYEFDVNYLDRLALNNKWNLNESANNLESLKYVLIKSLAVSMSSLSVEENKFLLEYFEEQVDNDSNKYVENLMKLVEFVSYVVCEIDLNEELKTVFSEFVQKLLIQLQPVYIGLKSNNDLNNLIGFLKFQARIIVSKYFLLPSHLVISTLQIFVLLDFSQFSFEQYTDLQELAFRCLNCILTRYSKKFAKISAVVCNLLTKFISRTTHLANQNNLDEDSMQLAIKTAQDFERFVTRLSSFKKDFCKIAPYIISEYVCIANTIPIQQSVKNILASAMYNLISICDIHGVSQLHVVLPVGARELFKTTYAEYEKYFKYTGKT